MTTLTRFDGVFTALVTPFTATGAIDWAAFDRHLDRQLAAGIAGLVPVGTTGEAATLDDDEALALISRTKARAEGAAYVLAGTGSNSTAKTVAATRRAVEAGVDGVLVVTPYYNKPNQEGLYRHFEAVSRAISIPIIVYNIPPRSVIDVSVETLARLAELKNIVGVKDATGNVGRILQQRARIGKNFVQFSGDDILALASVAVGAIGVISVVSNVAPKLCADMQNAALAGDFETALAIQDKLTALQQALFLEAGVTGAKYGLSLLGKVREEVRLPLVPSAEPTKQAIRAALIHAGVLAG